MIARELNEFREVYFIYIYIYIFKEYVDGPATYSESLIPIAIHSRIRAIEKMRFWPGSKKWDCIFAGLCEHVSVGQDVEYVGEHYTILSNTFSRNVSLSCNY